MFDGVTRLRQGTITAAVLASPADALLAQGDTYVLSSPPMVVRGREKMELI